MAITGTYAKRLLPMPINAIGTGDVEAALLRIWSDKNATAVDLQRYLSAGFAWAVVHGHRTDNPADLVKSQLPRVRKVAHQKALAYSDLADAIEKINGSGAYAGTKLLIEFLALTAVRTGEARGARWDEFNMDTRTWTVPAERMKSGKVHTVPLSNRVMAILEAATGVSRNGYVFRPLAKPCHMAPWPTSCASWTFPAPRMVYGRRSGRGRQSAPTPRERFAKPHWRTRRATQ